MRISIHPSALLYRTALATRLAAIPQPVAWTKRLAVASGASGGSPRDAALHDAPAVALELLDVEAEPLQMLERLPHEVVGHEADRERVEQMLTATNELSRAADVLGEEESPSWAQHPTNLGDRGSVVGDRAE